MKEGVRYLDDKRLRNIVNDLYRSKRKGKIIFITVTALCYIANGYGQTFFAFPVAIRDFGLTSLYQAIRKGFVAILLSAVGPLLHIDSPVPAIFALIFGVSGLTLAFNNLDVIPTSPVDVTKGLKPRISDISDIVVVNNRDKVILRDPVQKNHECWLPDQRLLNPKCEVKPAAEIPDAINSILPDLRYEDTVNMQDVTGLDREEFSDKFDLGQTCKPRQGKEVNFLNKFGDSGQVSESEKWDTCDNEFMVPKKRDLRTRNKPKFLVHKSLIKYFLYLSRLRLPFSDIINLPEAYFTTQTTKPPSRAF